MLMRAVFISLALGLFNNVSAQDLNAVQAETQRTIREGNKYWNEAQKSASVDRTCVDVRRACTDLLDAEETRIAAFSAWKKAMKLRRPIDIAVERLKLIGDNPPPVGGDPNRDTLIAACRKLTRAKK